MQDIRPLHTWPNFKGLPYLIAGPCSAETPDQVRNTCAQIASGGKINLLRAGVWKPRTRPGHFEGIGEAALPWLQEASLATGLPLTVEVATAKHVEVALKYGVDVLWIGARSTVNPFTVQEIANALQGVDIPVMVKNPINPDLALWIGALERLYQAGLRSLAAIHRGFSALGVQKYRNPPQWQLALSLKSQLPSIPLFFDPSHTGGKRNLIYPLSQKAMNLNYEGLMIESHQRPDEAWSDAAQQLTPADLNTMLAQLCVRKTSVSDESENLFLEELRQRIDAQDRELIEILTARMELVEDIGYFKKAHNLAIFQRERWTEVFKTRPEWALELGLSAAFVEKLFLLIHDESINIQTSTFKKNLSENPFAEDKSKL